MNVSHLSIVLFTVSLLCPAEAPGERVHWDSSAQRLELRGDDGSPWLRNAFARIVLADGSTLQTTDDRYEATKKAENEAVVIDFVDRRGLADLQWTLTPLDGQSATLQLRIDNRGEEPLTLDRLEVLVGRFCDAHDPSKPHVLRNGFVLSPPHPTTRRPTLTALTSRETAAIESPPVAAGWLTGKHNFGHVDFRELNDYPVIFAWGECNGVLLPAGASRTSDLFFLSTHENPLVEMERFATLAGEINRAKIWPPRIAWCTWYAGWQRKQMAVFEGGMEPGIERMIPLVRDLFASRWPQTMRICDDFIDYGDWSNKTKTIPGGLDRLARLIDEAGIIPGVWYSPYWAKSDSKVLAEHPEWFARDKQGNIWFETGGQPKGRDAEKFAVFDTTHPEVVEYFEDTARTWRERGFRYVSTDFLNWSFAPDRYHDPTKTKAEVLRAGMAAIRRGLGPDVFYRPINNPLGVAMGIADDTRISGDSHGDNPTAYFRTGEIWFYNRRLWLNDPSAIVCARPDRAREPSWNHMWVSWIAMAGTVMTYGEVLDKLPERYIEMYQRVFPPLPVAGRPLDIWENEPYMLWGMDPGEADGPYTLFGVFDVTGKAAGLVSLNLDEIHARVRGWNNHPAKAPADYVLWDFWNEKLLRSEAEQLEVEVAPKSGRIFALRPRLGRPQLLGTRGHFSQGVVETEAIRWNATENTLSGKVRGNGGDPTTLYFLVPDSMRLVEASLGADRVETIVQEPGVIALQVPATGEPLDFALRIEGTAEEAVERPFVAGRSATPAD